MIEEATTQAVSFSALYTPFVTQLDADKINKIKDTFAKKNPDHVNNIYTGNSKFPVLLSAVCCLSVQRS